MGNQARQLLTLESIDVLMNDHSQYRPPVSVVSTEGRVRRLGASAWNSRESQGSDDEKCRALQ